MLVLGACFAACTVAANKGVPVVPTPVADSAALCFATTEDGSMQLSTCTPPKPTQTPNASSANWQVTVDTSSARQEIIGFGASWTDAAVTVFDALSADAQDALLHDLFAVPPSAAGELLAAASADDGANGARGSSSSGGGGGGSMTRHRTRQQLHAGGGAAAGTWTGTAASATSGAQTGIGLSLMRHTIGQSDLTPASIGEWSFDTSPDGKPDPTLAHFNLTAPGERMLAWIKRMQQAAAPAPAEANSAGTGDETNNSSRSHGTPSAPASAPPPGMTLFGSPWSPPQWMKEAGSNQLAHAEVNAWVGYFVKFLQAYAAQGVHVDAITMQNEPLHSADPAWTMSMSAADQAVLAERLAAAISAAGLDTKLWAYDHNTDQPEYPQAVLDNTTAGVIDAVAWHCYASGPPDAVWAPLRAFGAQNPGVPQVATECWTHLDTGENFFDLPTFIGRPLQYGAAGSMAWTVAGSVDYDVSYPGGCAPCSGLVQVNLTNGTAIKTMDYFTMGQFSRFVRPGFFYLNVTGGNYDYPDGTGVQVNAFWEKPAATEAVTSREAEPKEGGGGPAALGGRRVLVIQNKVRNALTIEVALGDDLWVGPVPARSVATWVLPSQSSARAW